jgi:hypothetical protein
MGHHQPAPLFSITHQIHMEDIQGSGGSWHGFITTNAMIFGPDLLMSAKLSAGHHPKVGMAWHPWAIIIQHHSAASLIRAVRSK